MAIQISANQVTERGDATGRIHGINHLVVIVDDMDESVRFYRDLLGFKVVRTLSYAQDSSQPLRVPKTYFLDIGSADGMLLGLFEVERDPSLTDLGREPALIATLWPGDPRPMANPRKMDHLAFNVDTHDDLVWFQTHLIANGVEVSEVVSARHDFVESIYLYDPSGIPVEIATFDWDNPRWNDKRGVSEQDDWLQDTDPVPALRGEDS